MIKYQHQSKSLILNRRKRKEGRHSEKHWRKLVHSAESPGWKHHGHHYNWRRSSNWILMWPWNVSRTVMNSGLKLQSLIAGGQQSNLFSAGGTSLFFLNPIGKYLSPFCYTSVAELVSTIYSSLSHSKCTFTFLVIQIIQEALSSLFFGS